MANDNSAETTPSKRFALGRGDFWGAGWGILFGINAMKT